ncbi:SpoU_methylase domain-containing protein [Haematococcus lacustris]|uniref:SpoU_methylase domain-containing protein n=1 Tax=Haematococcus lacustris TaxID=44745 RepID=A0A699YPZ6_HAELA|nr:SpoU_methylase domain-containing protein [Haematococcus lacustris]
MHTVAAHTSAPTYNRTATLRCRNGPRTRACATHGTILPPLGFPHSNEHSFDGKLLSSEDVIEALAPYMTEERLVKIQAIAKRRTYSVLPVVEGLYDMGNLSAVCRSADAFGMGAVHCIKHKLDKYKQSARQSGRPQRRPQRSHQRRQLTVRRADKWLDVQVWPDTPSCVTAIKAAGYQLVVTHLNAASIPIQEVDWSRPTAFVLGNEKSGVSEEMVAAADHLAVIPMAGFVESFNISVAAALVMYEAQQQRLRRTGRHADLTQQQARDLTAALMLRSVREGPTVVRELLTRPPPRWQAPRIKNYLAKQERLMRAEEAALGPSPPSRRAAGGQLQQQEAEANAWHWAYQDHQVVQTIAASHADRASASAASKCDAHGKVPASTSVATAEAGKGLGVLGYAEAAGRGMALPWSPSIT